MKNRILELLKESKSYSIDEIKETLNITDSEELKEYYKVMNELEDEYIIYKSKKEKFSLFENTNLEKGRLRVNKKGFGFVNIEGEEEDIYVKSDNMNKAIHNDIVLVEPMSKQSGEKIEGRILKIIKRENNTFVGEYIKKKSHGYVLLDDTNVKLRIDIDHDDSKGAMSGHKVLVKLLGEKEEDTYNGKVVEIIGHKNDPGVDILSIVYKYNIDTEFPDEVMQEVEDMPDDVSNIELGNRKDLRKERIITIDGLDAKDLDDAISIKKLDNGNYSLGVHIADVSYYVKEGTELDKEAYERGTSVYLADRVIPMLPHILSNGICSLSEHVDRLTLTCEMEINHRGEVVAQDIYESIINSTKRCDYTSVNKIIQDNKQVEGYDEVEGMLRLMHELSLIIRNNREERGSLNFDNDEPKIIVDETGKAIDIKRRNRGEAEKLIEDFMIIANETVASHIFHMDYPFVYRIHEYPKTEKIRNFLQFAASLGYKIKPRGDYRKPKDVQAILEALEETKEKDIFSSLLLRCMKKAIYTPENKGHFGLASKCYTHFTSPIRRYPDTTVHRLLRTYLFEHKIDMDTINHYKTTLAPLTEHSSKKERDSEECEREVDDMKMAEYMMAHIGEEHDGIITSVLNFGMFITLPNLIEGMVHISEMTDDYYNYDELNHQLVGQSSKITYKIGDSIRIKVKAASKEERKIDFEIIKKR